MCTPASSTRQNGAVVSTELTPAVHGPPPDRKLPARPSIVDTVRLFTLSTEQAFAFVQLADALASELSGGEVVPAAAHGVDRGARHRQEPSAQSFPVVCIAI